MRSGIPYKDAPEYCHYFFDLVDSDDLLAELEKSGQMTIRCLLKVRPEKADYSYQPEKWTVKEVLQHIIDCERVYSYRAFRFSRFDATELAGFDERSYISNSAVRDRSLAELQAEYESVRAGTISLYRSMSQQMLDFRGSANKNIFTARSLGYMTVGHNLHHCNFLLTNYLSED